MAGVTKYRHLSVLTSDGTVGTITLELTKLCSTGGRDTYAYGAACCSPKERAWSRAKGRKIAGLRLQWFLSRPVQSENVDNMLRTLCGVVSVESSKHPEVIYETIIELIRDKPRCPRWLRRK